MRIWWHKEAARTNCHILLASPRDHAERVDRNPSPSPPQNSERREMSRRFPYISRGVGELRIIKIGEGLNQMLLKQLELWLLKV
jgi:hypothetical protein